MKNRALLLVTVKLLFNLVLLNVDVLQLQLHVSVVGPLLVESGSFDLVVLLLLFVPLDPLHSYVLLSDNDFLEVLDLLVQLLLDKL